MAISAVSVLVLTTGCASSRQVRGAAAPGGDAVKVTGVAPDPRTQLHPGEVVTFRVRLLSTLLSGDLGHVSLVIQDDHGRSLTKGGTQPRMAVARGTENLELHAEVSVPLDTRWVEVLVPLFREGMDRTSAVDSVRFQVVR